jgi:hypothetical protein
VQVVGVLVLCADGAVNELFLQFGQSALPLLG